MLITELDTIEYLEFVKKLFRDNEYKFLILFVARYGDNKKFFRELEEYWSSIDNLTSDKIVFLNFSSSINRSIENDKKYLIDAYGYRIVSKEIQPLINYNVQKLFESISYAGNYRRQAEKENDYSSYYWDRYHNTLQSVRLAYLPNLNGSLNQNISESATQLLKYLHKNESDVPFLYLFDLRKNNEHFFKIDDIYFHHTNLYKFIQKLVIKIENEEKLNTDIQDCENEIRQITEKYDINKRENTLKRKQRQLLNNQIAEYEKKIICYNNMLNTIYNDLFDTKYNPIMRKIDKFIVSFTYASEKREYVEQVAKEVERIIGEGNVFYDYFYQAQLAKLDLDTTLQDIYLEKSDFIVVFLSKEYEVKEWCGLEWRAIRDLIKRKQNDKIILVKLEDFNLKGILSIDGYLDGSINSPKMIADLICKRILL